MALSAANTIDEVALTTPPRLWAGLAATAASNVAALVALAALLAAALLAVGAAGRALRGRSTWREVLGAALWCGAVGATVWLDALLLDALVLRDLSDVHGVARLAPLRPLGLGLALAAVVLAAPAAWIRGGGVARAAAAALGILFVAERWSVERVLTLGPDPRIAVVAPMVPHHVPAQANRVPWGCVLWKRGPTWEGISLVRDLPRPATGCPTFIGPGSFPRGQTPLFAVPGDTPVEAIAGWTVEPQGDVGILVRLEDEPPRRLAEWRISEVRVGVRQPPVDGDVRTRPLAGAILLDASRAEDDLGALLGTALRVELLVLPEVAPTVADLLHVCGAAVRAHPRGLQCTLAAGEGWGEWNATRD
jgi:hypothetical protein